jgi:RNA polymerase sigma-70 factor (ECF subfamily)
MVSEAACFATTHWSVVLNAQAGDAPGASEALEVLCRTYYYPLYAFVRRRGHTAAEAQDLAQEFFHRFLAKDYLSSVAPEKGKFRSFLLASLQNFLNVARVRESALKRGGGQTLVPLEDASVEERFLLEPALDLPPEAAYDRGWATTLMERAWQALREEFRAEGKSELFEQLMPFLSREPADGEYAQRASAAGLTPGAFSVAVHRLRQRYGQRVRAEVANTVAHAADVEAELRYLFQVLNAG